MKIVSSQTNITFGIPISLETVFIYRDEWNGVKRKRIELNEFEFELIKFNSERVEMINISERVDLVLSWFAIRMKAVLFMK